VNNCPLRKEEKPKIKQSGKKRGESSSRGGGGGSGMSERMQGLVAMVRGKSSGDFVKSL